MDLMEARRRILMDQPHSVTLSGGLVHFQTDMDGLMQITGSGNVTVCGSNLIDDTKRQIGSTEIFIGSTDNQYHIPLKAGIYTFSTEIDQAATVYMRASGASSSFFSTGMSASKRVVEVTVPSDCIARINFYKSGGIDKNKLGRCWLNYGSATLYEQYTATTATAGTARKSLVGINNVWSDSGSVTVTYWTH